MSTAAEIARNRAHPAPSQELDALVAARFEQSTTVPQAFFAAEADRIADACWAMARRFHRGGRLLAFGNGAWASDAQHVAVEFVHPVIVGKRALPAIALSSDGIFLSNSASQRDGGPSFEHHLTALARPDDMALGFAPQSCAANVVEALRKAKGMGLLTLGLAGEDGDNLAEGELDFCFVVRSADPLVVQETHETLYHILWELVHVFFEHEGLLEA